MAQIAIVGGGPSGAMCGEQLARAATELIFLTSIWRGKNPAAAV